MTTLLEILREDQRSPVLKDLKWAGRYIVNDISQAIAEIERLQSLCASIAEDCERIVRGVKK